MTVAVESSYSRTHEFYLHERNSRILSYELRTPDSARLDPLINLYFTLNSFFLTKLNLLCTFERITKKKKKKDRYNRDVRQCVYTIQMYHILSYCIEIYENIGKNVVHQHIKLYKKKTGKEKKHLRNRRDYTIVSGRSITCCDVRYNIPLNRRID